MSIEESLARLSDVVLRETRKAHELGIREGIEASGNGRLVEIIDQLSVERLASTNIIDRLITCAENGYDTAELRDIVADAKKAVGR